MESTDFQNVIAENIPQLFFYSEQHSFWNFIENKNEENSIMKIDKI